MIKKLLNFCFSIVLLLLSFSAYSQVTDYTPKTTIAGNGILTILGSGFGATRGANAYVVFGGFHPIKVLETDYMLWSNNEIRVKVPLGAIGSFTVVVSPSVSYKVDNVSIAYLGTSDAYSPSHISAGTESVLTITGSGFGPSKTANNAVEFLLGYAQLASVKAAPSDFVSWSDTKIEVKVPSGAGDGPIYITMDNGTMKTIHPWLTIDFNIYKQDGLETKLYNQNGSGGYTFHLHSKLNSNNKAKAAFLRAFETWKCATGVNWTIGEPTSSKTGSNVVRILDDGEADVGAPGQTAVSYLNIGGVWYVNNIAISFSNYLDHYFKFSPSDPGLYDFESVALHTLGKAHNLGVVVSQNDVMYWARAVNSTEKRSLSSYDLAAGKYVMNLSKIASGSVPAMVPLSLGTCNTTYSYINSFSPTAARGGEIVTITGTDFSGVTSVKFGNTAASSFNVVSPTQITAVVSIEGASGDITVTGAGGVAAATGFTYISRLAQTLNSISIPSKTYGDADFDLGVTASTGLPINYSTSNSSVATIINNKVHIISAGSVVITATQVGNATFSPVSTNFNLTINKADQIITFSSIPAKLTSDPDFDLGAMASSGLAVVYTNSNPSVATITNGRVHILKTGNTTITAVQDGNSNYNAAPTISYDLTVSNLPQILLFPEIAAKKVNDADFEPGATVNSGLPITYTSSNPNVATIENNKIHIVGAGTSTITASQNGNLIYAAASKQVILTVSKLNQTLSFPNLTVKDVNAMDFDAGAIASSNLAITYTSSNLNVATIVNNKVHIVGAGTTTITALQIGDATYNAVSASANLTVIKLIQSINIPQIAIKTFNDPDFDLNATVSSGLSPIYTSSNTNVATVANNKVHIVGAGTASITVSQVGNAIYEAANNAVNLTVNKLPQTITFPQIALKNYNDVDFDLNAVSSSGLPITYKSANTSVATIIGSKVHIVASGSTVITASQIGDNNINTASEIAQNLDVIYTLPNSNFTIKTTDETCKTSDNGAINITATQTLSYVATITGNNKTTTHPFNSILAVNNLPSGLYNVCITVVGQTYKQCFDLVIKEPKDLAVYASLKDGGNTVLLKLEGSDFYKIELNGQLITTTDREISLPLIKGNNIVKISSNKTCQGVVEQSFITSNLISLYPNPVKDKLTINTGSAKATQVKVEIHALDGRLVHSGQYKTEYGQISIDLSKLNKSLYVLTLSNGNTKTVHKIIKD